VGQCWRCGAPPGPVQSGVVREARWDSAEPPCPCARSKKAPPGCPKLILTVIFRGSSVDFHLLPPGLQSAASCARPAARARPAAGEPRASRLPPERAIGRGRLNTRLVGQAGGTGEFHGLDVANGKPIPYCPAQSSRMGLRPWPGACGSRPRGESIETDARLRSQSTQNEVERRREGKLWRTTKLTVRMVPLSSRLSTWRTRQGELVGTRSAELGVGSQVN